MGDDEDVLVEAKGFKIPIPRWARNAAAAVVILGAVVYGGLWISEKIERGKIRISPAEKMQLDLAASKFGETPVREYVAYDNEFGTSKTLEYADGVAAWIRKKAGGPRQVLWAADPKVSAPPPSAAISSSEPFGILADPAQAGGMCPCHFQGPFFDQAQPLADCWIEVFRRFEHGCVLSWRRNTCYGYDEADGNGNIVFRWHRCAH